MSGKFAVGDRVRVRKAYPPGHVRTPYFTRGKQGIVTEIAGQYANPEELAYGRGRDSSLVLYRVQFRQNELWSQYSGPDNDTAVVDIYENWLEAVEETE